MIGLGSDILDIRRIEKTLSRFGERFKKRIFTESEIKKCEQRRLSVECFAKRFAAKEAFVKALGTGFRNGINFNDISVKNKNSGKPELYVNDKIKKIIKKKFKLEKFKIFLSLSDEKKYSIAFVVINKL